MPASVDRALRFLDAGGERVGLVEARHDDGELDLAPERLRGRVAQRADGGAQSHRSVVGGTTNDEEPL